MRHGIRRRIMTREAFETFMRDRNAQMRIFVRPPYQLVPCDCGDVNCHGWRFVELEARVRPAAAEQPQASA